MTSKLELDISKSKAKHTKALVYRAHQGLKKELKNIDSEYSKSLSTIHRDLEKTRHALKALRITQKQVKRDSISRHNVHQQGMDFDLRSMPLIPTPPLQRRPRASTIPPEHHSSKVVYERCRSEVSEISIY
jgi:hypothetical protein